MKKFLLYLMLTLGLLAGIFAYILYTEGVFETQEPVKENKLEPFMKCEAGKCAPGKCAGN